MELEEIKKGILKYVRVKAIAQDLVIDKLFPKLREWDAKTDIPFNMETVIIDMLEKWAIAEVAKLED